MKEWGQTGRKMAWKYTLAGQTESLLSQTKICP